MVRNCINYFLNRNHICMANIVCEKRFLKERKFVTDTCCAKDSTTDSHCAFSSNFFHRQIAQIYIDHLSGPINKKCSPWRFFVTNHPQIWPLLTRRCPRSPDMRLSKHYIGTKMTCWHFSNFCIKKFLGLTKKLLHIFV
jgi:hypothetical protein